MSNFVKQVKFAIKHWYLLLIAGAVLILSGIYVMSTPADSYVALSIVFSISFIVAGISEIIFAFSNKEILDGWGWYLVLGLLTLLMGIFLISNPGISVTILPFVVGFTIMFRSFQALGFAYDLKNYGIVDWGSLAIIGVLGVILSFILIFNPVFAGLSLVIWTGIAFILAGAASIYLSLKIKKVNDAPSKIPEELKKKWADLQAEINDSMKASQSSAQ